MTRKTKRRTTNIMLDDDFIREFRMIAAANDMSMAQLSRELADIDNGLKKLRQRLKLL